MFEALSVIVTLAFVWVWIGLWIWAAGGGKPFEEYAERFDHLGDEEAAHHCRRMALLGDLITFPVAPRRLIRRMLK